MSFVESSNASRYWKVKLPTYPVRTEKARLGLPGNVVIITGSALTPLRESVTALPAFLPTDRKAGHPADLPVTEDLTGAQETGTH